MKINNKKCKDILELINIAEEKFGNDVNIDLSEDNVNYPPPKGSGLLLNGSPD